MLYHCLQETEFYNKYLHETCPPPIQSSSSPDSSLRPVTLGLVQEEQEDTGAQESWRRQFEMNKREVDFFADTLDIRKDAIASYQDYKKEEFSRGSLIEEEGVTETDDESVSDDEDEDEDEDDDTISLVSANESQSMTRNLHVERIVKLFNEMMVYRSVIEDDGI